MRPLTFPVKTSAMAADIHNAYLKGLSKDRAIKYEHCEVTNIRQLKDGSLIAIFQQGGKKFKVNIKDPNLFMKEMCGGKIDVAPQRSQSWMATRLCCFSSCFFLKVKGDQINTKQDSVSVRINKAKTALKMLQQCGLGKDWSNQKITDIVKHGVFDDNASALNAAHWMQQLESFHGYSESDVTHLLWCFYTGWDSAAKDMYKQFPLVDGADSEKDAVVIKACLEALTKTASQGKKVASEAKPGVGEAKELMENIGELLNLNPETIGIMIGIVHTRESLQQDLTEAFPKAHEKMHTQYQKVREAIQKAVGQAKEHATQPCAPIKLRG